MLLEVCLSCGNRCRAAISKCAVDRAMMMGSHDEGYEWWLWGRGKNVHGMHVQSVRRGAGGCVGGASCNSSLCVRHPMHHLLCHQAPALIVNVVRRISTLGPGSR